MGHNTAEIYNSAAESWVRQEPVALSDFTGRPALFSSCGDVKGLHIADIGCGEGYCARVLNDSGAAKIDGIDISGQMVDAARHAAAENPRMSFQVANAVKIPFADNKYDIAIGVFVYNYLSIEQTYASFAEVFRILKPTGRFIFCVPHPAFPFIRKERSKPFYFNFDHGGYFSNRNKVSEGKIWRLDGVELPVEMQHKLFSDYIDALNAAGFCKMPKIQELGVTDELLAKKPDFFTPLCDTPLHLLFTLEK